MDHDLPEGWQVWNEEPGGQVVLVFRPDVFEGESFPEECLPTLHVSPRSPDGPPRRRGGSAWHVALYLEPTVRVRSRDETHPDRETALAAAVEVAAAFSRGDVDPAAVYQLPREEYLAELDALTGDGDPDAGGED